MINMPKWPWFNALSKSSLVFLYISNCFGPNGLWGCVAVPCSSSLVTKWELRAKWESGQRTKFWEFFRCGPKLTQVSLRGEKEILSPPQVSGRSHDHLFIKLTAIQKRGNGKMRKFQIAQIFLKTGMDYVSYVSIMCAKWESCIFGALLVRIFSRSPVSKLPD